MFGNKMKKFSTTIDAPASLGVIPCTVKFDVEYDAEGVKFPIDVMKKLKEHGLSHIHARDLITRHLVLEFASREDYKNAFFVAYSKWRK